MIVRNLFGLHQVFMEEEYRPITPTHVEIKKVDDKQVTEEETKDLEITIDVEPDIDYIDGEGLSQ